MKEELIQLAEHKGFAPLISHELHIIKNLSSIGDEDVYYIFLCELQKWLREKHGIHVEIKLDIILNPPFFSKRIIRLSGCASETGLHSYEFKTHEQALEHGLLEGLKLLP